MGEVWAGPGACGVRGQKRRTWGSGRGMRESVSVPPQDVTRLILRRYVHQQTAYKR